MGTDRQIEGEGDATLSALNFQIRHSKAGHKSRETLRDRKLSSLREGKR